LRRPPWAGRTGFAQDVPKAGEAILNHAAKAIEIEDIEARVTELERAAGTSQSM
jgi:hypothetical protein